MITICRKNGSNELVKERAFEILESLRREAPEIDYDKELESYRTKKYGATDN